MAYGLILNTYEDLPSRLTIGELVLNLPQLPLNLDKLKQKAAIGICIDCYQTNNWKTETYVRAFGSELLEVPLCSKHIRVGDIPLLKDEFPCGTVLKNWKVSLEQKAESFAPERTTDSARLETEIQRVKLEPKLVQTN